MRSEPTEAGRSDCDETAVVPGTEDDESSPQDASPPAFPEQIGESDDTLERREEWFRRRTGR